MTYRGNSARSYNPITGEERTYTAHGERPTDVPQINLSEVPHEAPSYRSAKSVHVERQIDSYQQILNKMNTNQKQAAKPSAPTAATKPPNVQPIAQQPAVNAKVPPTQVQLSQNYSKPVAIEKLDVPRLTLDDENQNPVLGGNSSDEEPVKAQDAREAERYPHLRSEFDSNFIEYHFPYLNSSFARLQTEIDDHGKSALGYSETDRNSLVEATLNEHLGKTTRVAQQGELTSEERSAMRTVLKQTAGLNTARLNELQRTVTKKELNEERVRFTARLIGADDRECLKELTGYYFPLDGSVLVYEFCSHLIGRSYTVGGKLDRARQLEILPFLKRFAYLQRSVNVSENSSELQPIGLLDIYVGNTLHIPVNDKENNAAKVLSLRIVSVDQTKLESHIEKMYSSALNAQQTRQERLITLYYFRALSQNVLEETLFYRQFQRSVIESEQSTTRLQSWALLQYVAKQAAVAGRASSGSASFSAAGFEGVSLTDLDAILHEMGVAVLEADLHRFFFGLYNRLRLLGFGAERCEVQSTQVAPTRGRTNSQQAQRPVTIHVEKVDARILVRHVFGEMPEWRKMIVRRVFQRLDPRRTGTVPLIEAIKAFNPTASFRPHYDEFLRVFTEYARTCARVAARLAPRTARSSARAESIDLNEVRISYFEFELFYDNVSAARFGVADAALDAEFIRFVHSCWQSIL